MRKCYLLSFMLLCFALSSFVCATAPPLREEVSLNGQWPLGGTVPVYWGQRRVQITYQRDVAVPAWTGKLIHLEFEKVNHIADVYVNDQLVTHHIGGWIPFSVDITRYAHAGTTFSLRVVAQAGTVPPFVDGKNHLLWPLGAFASARGAGTGIVDNVWLRAYGRTHIDDAFVQTSLRNKQLRIAYTLRNDDTVARRVHIDAEARRESTGKVEKRQSSQPVTLAPGETTTLQLIVPWQNPALWMPDHPTLYTLHSKLMDDAQCLDQETRRFGFREIWIAGNQYMLNGIRINLWGDNIPQSPNVLLPAEQSAEGFAARVDRMMQELHIRIVRFHMEPAPTFALNVADEKGLLIIAESAMYGRHGIC